MTGKESFVKGKAAVDGFFENYPTIATIVSILLVMVVIPLAMPVSLRYLSLVLIIAIVGATIYELSRVVSMRKAAKAAAKKPKDEVNTANVAKEAAIKANKEAFITALTNLYVEVGIEANTADAMAKDVACKYTDRHFAFMSVDELLLAYTGSQKTQ